MREAVGESAGVSEEEDVDKAGKRGSRGVEGGGVKSVVKFSSTRWRTHERLRAYMGVAGSGAAEMHALAKVESVMYCLHVQRF